MPKFCKTKGCKKVKPSLSHNLSSFIVHTTKSFLFLSKKQMKDSSISNKCAKHRIKKKVIQKTSLQNLSTSYNAKHIGYRTPASSQLIKHTNLFKVETNQNKQEVALQAMQKSRRVLPLISLPLEEHYIIFKSTKSPK